MLFHLESLLLVSQRLGGPPLAAQMEFFYKKDTVPPRKKYLDVARSGIKVLQNGSFLRYLGRIQEKFHVALTL